MKTLIYRGDAQKTETNYGIFSLSVPKDVEDAAAKKLLKSGQYDEVKYFAKYLGPKDLVKVGASGYGDIHFAKNSLVPIPYSMVEQLERRDLFEITSQEMERGEDFTDLMTSQMAAKLLKNGIVCVKIPTRSITPTVGKITKKTIDQGYRKKKVGVVGGGRNHKKKVDVIWEAPVFDPSGYSIAAHQMILALDKLGVNIQVCPERYWSDFGEADKILGLDSETRKRLDELIENVVPTSSIRIHDKTPELYNSRQNEWRLKPPIYRIGFTVYETNRLHPLWVKSMNSLDEIWTCSHFCKEVFQTSGVVSPIKVMPHGIDFERFNPDIKPLDFERREFNFLSIFQWTPRKGFDVLISAYLQEFKDTEDVGLILRVYRSNTSESEKKKILQDIYNIEEKVKVKRNIPSIFLLPDFLTDKDYPSLFTSADAFVLPTRGEAWGMPISEAMACGLPVICTNWSGPKEFMDESNAYPLKVKKIVPCRGMDWIPWYLPKQQWAEPDVDHLRYLMRYVFEHREEAREKGLQASQDVKKWTWTKTAKKMKRRLESIA